jgi:hypothetical protein
MNKTFVFENWEGDWASRGGGYDPLKPASELARMSMRKWLAARQAGVTSARDAVLGAGDSNIPPHSTLASGGGAGDSNIPPHSTLASGGGGGSSGGGNVLYSAEVNLVQESRVGGVPNMINTVIPFVELDMVSYSSYDTESDPVTFRAALEYIQHSHNRESHTPHVTCYTSHHYCYEVDSHPLPLLSCCH